MEEEEEEGLYTSGLHHQLHTAHTMKPEKLPDYIDDEIQAINRSQNHNRVTSCRFLT